MTKELEELAKECIKNDVIFRQYVSHLPLCSISKYGADVECPYLSHKSVQIRIPNAYETMNLCKREK